MPTALSGGDGHLKVKTLTTIGILTALALIIFIVEAQIPPPVAVPGVKLGLANVVTLITLIFLGRREAGLVLAARIILGSIFAGSVSTIIFSATGGVFCFAVMAFTVNRIPRKQLWVVSVLGAIAHNVGQLLAACFVMGTVSIWYYAPVLFISAIVTGVFTGFCAMYLARYEKWIGK